MRAPRWARGAGDQQKEGPGHEAGAAPPARCVQGGWAPLIPCSAREKVGCLQRPTWETTNEGEEDTVSSTASRGHPNLSLGLGPSWTLRAPWGQMLSHISQILPFFGSSPNPTRAIYLSHFMNFGSFTDTHQAFLCRTLCFSPLSSAIQLLTPSV